MEIEELYNTAIAPLIVSPFAVQWSQDNHISVLTEKGIHIFELIPSPLSPSPVIKFVRSFIYPPPTFPTEDAVSKTDARIWNMQREEIYSVIMEENLTPKLADVVEMVPKIVSLAWSPKNLIHPNKCLLAILTSTGAVFILYKSFMDWYPAYDLVSIRAGAKEHNTNTCSNDSRTSSSAFAIIRNHVQELQATAMSWSRRYADFAYLVVSYRNADIVIYKISRKSDSNNVLQPKIVGETNMKESTKINVIVWINISIKECVIVAGYFDGRICGLKFEDRGESFEVISVDMYYNCADRISVSSLQVISQNEQDIKILAFKGSFIFLLCLTTNGTLKSTQHLQTEGFSVSGITILSTDYALVTTENGIMYTIDMQAFRLTKVDTKSALPQSSVRYLGLAHSPSYVMFVNVTSPNTIYDHLITKEPSKMYLFVFKDDNVTWSTLLKKNTCNRLEELWDCLEIMRIKATKAVEPTSVLPKVPLNLETLSLFDLRIAMWISMITEVCEKKEVFQGIRNITGEISEAQPLLFVQTACDYLERLLVKASLSKEQEFSVNSLRMYLEVYLAGEESEELSPVSKRIAEVLEKTSQLNCTQIETCNLCGEVINELPWNVTKCPKGHILPRCAITLIQITTLKYRSCPICGLMFHPCLDEEYEETRCLFCDVPTLQSNLILDSGLNVSTDNSFSRKKPSASDVSEEKEAETEGH